MGLTLTLICLAVISIALALGLLVISYSVVTYYNSYYLSHTRNKAAHQRIILRYFWKKQNITSEAKYAENIRLIHLFLREKGFFP
jgi:hypothetical protein